MPPEPPPFICLGPSGLHPQYTTFYFLNLGRYASECRKCHFRAFKFFSGWGGVVVVMVSAPLLTFNLPPLVPQLLTFQMLMGMSLLYHAKKASLTVAVTTDVTALLVSVILLEEYRCCSTNAWRLATATTQQLMFCVIVVSAAHVVCNTFFFF